MIHMIHMIMKFSYNLDFFASFISVSAQQLLQLAFEELTMLGVSVPTSEGRAFFKC